MKRALNGKFSKKQHFKLPYQDNLKVILVFVYLLIIAFSGTYIAEAKAFHHNYLKQIIENFTSIHGTVETPPENDSICNERYREELPRIEDKIRKIFGKNGDEAVKIATCESQLNPETIGDTHLMFWHNGELLGDSIGVFQIRTGGRENGRVWNRGGAEFRELMKNPDENIKYAKELYDESGWIPWKNCKIKLGL